MVEGQEHLVAQALSYDVQRVVDVSGGRGDAARLFHQGGKDVTLTAFRARQVASDFPSEINIVEHQPITDMRSLADGAFDAAWCAHVLEHCPNSGLALDELYRIIRPGGWLFLMVPPFKPNVVGGHVTIGWNIGILMLVLLQHGFDVKHGHFVRHGYNIAAFVPKPEQPLALPELSHDEGDIELLQGFFPEAFQMQQNRYGDVKQCQWEWRVPHRLKFRRECKRRLKAQLLRLAYGLA